MNNIMIDIETVSTKMNSAVIQVAMLRFDWEGNISDEITLELALDEQIHKGLDINSGTLSWWLDTNPDHLKHLLNNGQNVDSILNIIKKYITFEDYLWCHATFDIPVLNNLFSTYNCKIPWAFKKVRDIRTLVDLANLDLTQYNWDQEKTHDALDDCRFQVKYCCDAYRMLNKDL